MLLLIILPRNQVESKTTRHQQLAVTPSPNIVSLPIWSGNFNVLCLCQFSHVGHSIALEIYKAFLRTMSTHLDKIRILVVGDSGVGKTSLIYGLAHSDVLRASSWTIGCSVEVLLHDHKNLQQTICVELLDVGGSTSHKNSRSIFYNGINGIILVHDLSNRKSYLNLKGWLSEALSAGKQELTGILVRGGQIDANGYDNDAEHLSNSNLPILIVGTKLDQVTETRISNIQDNFGLLEQTGAESIQLSCLDSKSFTPGSGIWQRFRDFFDKVADKRTSTKATFSPSRVMQREFPSMVFSRTGRTKF